MQENPLYSLQLFVEVIIKKIVGMSSLWNGFPNHWDELCGCIYVLNVKMSDKCQKTDKV